MDTFVWRSGPDGYDVTPSNSPEVIGRIWVKARGVIGGLWAKGGAAIIEPRSRSPLNGISAGPYASCEAAMSAIGVHLKGACELKDPRAN